jgi:hypothetical protein
MRSQRSGERTTRRSEAPPWAARKRAVQPLVAIITVASEPNHDQLFYARL